MLGVRAERMDVGSVAPEDDGGSGRDARARSGRYRAAGGAVADRVPLPLRVLAESLPAGVRGGETGLQRMHAVVLGVVILAGLVVALVSSGLGRPDVTPVPAGPTPVDAASTDAVIETGTPVPVSAVDETPETVVVHVAGKVAHPGIVELPAGSRVVDAVEAAGGADDGVDLSALNLARVLVDGEQIVVGVAAPAGPLPTAGSPTGTLVNLNTATTTELESLPEVGPVTALAIITWRDEHGGFTDVQELLEVDGIGEATLETIAPFVTV